MKFLKKDLIKTILKIAIPIIIGNLLQIAYQMTDLFWVGKVGTDQIAAIAISGPVLFLFMSIGIGISISGLILVAQKFGAKNQTKINELSGQMMTIMLSLGTLFSILGYFLTPYFIRFNSATDTVTNLAIQYTQISFLGTIALYGIFCYKDLLSGIQEMILPLKIVTLTVIINFFLDPLLIIYFDLGIKGAAYATIFNQFLSFGIGLYILLKGKYGIKIDIHHLIPNKKMIKNVLKLSIPSSIELSAISLAHFFLMGIIALYSTHIIAGFGIALQIFSIVIFISIGILVATSTLVGEQIGAKNIQKAKDIALTSLTFGTIISIIITILSMIFAKQLISIFTSDQFVIIEGAKILKIISLTFTLFAIQKILTGVFQGSGNPQIPSAIAVLALWVIELPLAYILSQYTPLAQTGIWIAIVSGGFLAATISIIAYFKFPWHSKSIVNHE